MTTRRSRIGGRDSVPLLRRSRTATLVSLAAVRRILFLSSAIVLADTVLYTALTPLLPHYADELGLSKAGAGILAAAYPAGALVGAIPSGIVAARAGVKPTVLVGMSCVGATMILFAFGSSAWQLDLARFAQGLASAFSWTGALAWLVAVAPAGRRGTLIGQAFAAAVAGALLGPVVGAIAGVVGIRPTFIVVALASASLAAWAAVVPAQRPDEPQPLGALAAAARRPVILAGIWFVTLPALLFGTLGVLAPLRLSALGFGTAAIGATWLVAAALESANNVYLGRIADRRGPLVPIRAGLAASAVVAALLPWPENGLALAALVVAAGLSFGAFFTPGMTMLTQAAEEQGLDYGYAFALVNLAWAPGQTGGSAVGGAIAEASSDAVAYLTLAAICLLTLAFARRFSRSIAPTMRSELGSSGS
jgi:predicted MFS family arabinose efflux permease